MWGHRRIQGELARLGHTIAKTAVWQILTDNGIDPSPNRSDVTWSEFLHSQAAVACDFFTQSLGQRPPTPLHDPPEAPPATVTVLRTSRCDGLIHEYRNAA